MRKARLACWLLPLAAASLGAAVAADPIQEAERWDRIFGQKEPRYRTEPNEFLGHMLARLEGEKWIARDDPAAAPRALDLAMGDGRNALLEAEQGFAVTGLDISTVALEKARASAQARGLALDAREADLTTFDYGVEQWDLLSILYFNPALDLADKLKASVRPGGVILVEGQGSEHEGGGPPPRTRFKPNALLETFRDWRILAYEDGRFESDWNPGTPTHVIRLMARKPSATPPGK